MILCSDLNRVEEDVVLSGFGPRTPHRLRAGQRPAARQATNEYRISFYASTRSRSPCQPGARRPRRCSYESDVTSPTTGAFDLPDFELELGGTLPAARLVYRTHGTLSAARDNAVLFPHQYSGTPASLDRWIGPGRPLDPQRWFVICPGQLGNGESSSPSNSEAPFPDLTIGDDVEAQRRLLDDLGIERVELALGFSMGAQQAWEWGVRFPARVRRLALFAGTAQTTPHGGAHGRSVRRRAAHRRSRGARALLGRDHALSGALPAQRLARRRLCLGRRPRPAVVRRRLRRPRRRESPLPARQVEACGRLAAHAGRPPARLWAASPPAHS